MTFESIVLESAEHIDTPTSHAIAAAQMRGEARAPGRNPRDVVQAVAQELTGLGLRPNVRELARRYQMQQGPRTSTWQREDGVTTA